MFELVEERLEEIYHSSHESSIANEKGIRDLNSQEDFFSYFIGIQYNIVETTSPLEINNIEKIDNLIDLKRINDVSDLSKFLEEVNKKLRLNGIFICEAETKGQRYRRIINKYPRYYSHLYYTLDFILKRLFPKWGPTRKINSFLTRGKNKVLSMSHILGMFVFSGFKINYFKEINNLFYFVVEKIKEYEPRSKPSCGILFKMERVGKNGKIINVYKLRTMHPYSEYIQEFIFNLNGSGNGDKITNDFRVATWGKFLRKYWLDEIPMLINLLKGDVKLVGVRPLSATKFNLYPLELQKLRISTKPGLIPPFYYDRTQNLDEIMDSEEKYLNLYEKHPLITDFKYFFGCLNNILLKGARSS